MKTPNWNKASDGLLPVIVQDATTSKVLMLGYMNEEAFTLSRKQNRVTFYSRSKQRLWTKGESSNNFLDIEEIRLDCDQDAILIKAHAHGPTCHRGEISCFDDDNSNSQAFTVYDLEKTIHQRIDEKIEGSYTYSLVQKGINKVAQKVGEEAVETVIDAINGKEEDFIYEAGDLMYHYLVLLKAKGYSLKDIENELAKRHKK
ncbi:phosphoribosyl-AMP cyclohydrolase [Nonlabens tegetincola]|uniref:Histidine biosynthesis bifunctional protein HisIE n=1 Tax=Nonlabens tegetincola TaxID=323273 RepID=A0A090Q2B9_9FLAO|nr:bifunctional phosphoribosyl-AMP cyclohydrolase/phosphoribosyl-ATP diphosphatase HisIE [Nonlabens tegetincola]GAK97229.1 phosphoribosyl-AMP cyclohydrolase [Nonlabens tegetincola]